MYLHALHLSLALLSIITVATVLSSYQKRWVSKLKLVCLRLAKLSGKPFFFQSYWGWCSGQSFQRQLTGSARHSAGLPKSDCL